MASTGEKDAALVMGTNSSSIVSKRSVERIYSPEPHVFRYFVKKPQRRSPLINRGYWLRMHAIERSVRQFLARPSGKPKLVVNLGCGFDPLPFQFLQHEPDLCRDAKFVDIDHYKLILEKRSVIQQCKELNALVRDVSFESSHGSVVMRGSQYLGIGCDLGDIQGLETALRSEVDFAQFSVLCVAEVSLTYMMVDAADALIRWIARLGEDVQFCLLEQCFPDGAEHPFAKTMMKHFHKLRTPLYSIQSYPSLQDQERRFVDCGWKHVRARSLWDLWNDSDFLGDEVAMSLDSIEPFDEWEELALFASHYFLLHASTSDFIATEPPQPVQLDNSGGGRQANFKLLSRCPARFCGQRRFSAIVPIGDGILGLHGGIGRQNRLATTDIYGKSSIEESTGGIPPSTLPPRVCHTITEFNDSTCLLVGGRSSPTSALGDCWLGGAGEWQQVQSLPGPRFRHSSTAVKLREDKGGVLVYGGKSGAGEVLSQFLLWTEGTGWQVIEPVGAAPRPRFGASFVGIDVRCGILCGGMDKRGRVLSDFWAWTLVESEEGVLSMELEDKTEDMHDTSSLFRLLGRFGASVNITAQHVVMIGGIGADGVIPHEYEILFLDLDALHGFLAGAGTVSVLPSITPGHGPRPLLVGHSSYTVEGGRKVLIVGGGAVCFSFGTHSNAGTWVLQKLWCGSDNGWSQVEPPANTTSARSSTVTPTNGQLDGDNTTPLKSIPRVRISSPQEFQNIVDIARPVIIEGLDIGSCTSQWTRDYLKERVGHDRKVVVHDSRSDNMNFQTKNFSYVTKEFGNFVDEVNTGSRQYLRAISSEKPTEKPANLSVDFPGLKNDFRLPPELRTVEENAHSSPLRVSGPVTLWLHYDVLANVLCQVRGEKTLILYPPWDVPRLGFAAGASSSTINVFQGASSNQRPISPAGTTPHEALLRPGDILFIPPTWLHSASPRPRTTATTTTASGSSPTEEEGTVSIAVNVFFHNLDPGSYTAGRDVYGNRDLQAYEQGRRDVEKIARNFSRLPRDISRFYLLRLADELGEKAGS